MGCREGQPIFPASPQVSCNVIFWRSDEPALPSAMLTIRAMSRGAGYAKKHLEQNDYYAEGEKVKGQWQGQGKGAEKLGLSGEVQHEQFERVRQGLHPDTGEKLRQREAPTGRRRTDRSRARGGRSTISRSPRQSRFRSWRFSPGTSGSSPRTSGPCRKRWLIWNNSRERASAHRTSKPTASPAT